MTVSDPKTVDILSHDPTNDLVTLIMVEHRPWGNDGHLLFDLQAKLNAYLKYVLGGQLVQDHPVLKGKPIEFQLRSVEPPGSREREFIEIVIARYLRPAGINWCEQPTPPCDHA